MGETGGGCAILVGIVMLIYVVIWIVIWVFKIFFITLISLSGILVMAIIPAVIAFVIFKTFMAMKNNDFEQTRAIILPSLTVLTGASIGFSALFGLSNPWVVASLVGSSVPLVGLLLYPPINRRRLIRKYREGEQDLIEP
ncbi:MAG: hypothetical protein AB4057_15615 [Crocosphaera sp.]